jgi:hypothetical protein
MKPFLTLIFVLTFWLANASDTILTSLILNDYPIFNVVADGQGRIFFSDKTGVKTLENLKIKDFDKSYSGDLLIEDGKLVYAERLENYGWEKRKKYRESQPQHWRSFLPADESPSLISSASQHNLYHYVAIGRKIYVFKTENRFKRFLKGQSTRKIYKKDDQLFVSTYSGLYRNEELWDSDNLGGPFLEDEGHWLSGSKNILWFFLKFEDQFEKIDSLDLSPLFNGRDIDITCLINYKDYYWIGTNMGLIIFHKEGTLKIKLNNLVIESFNLDKNILYISTSKGIFRVEEDLDIQKTDITNFNVNHFLIFPNRWLIATNNGLLEYNTTNLKIKNIKLLDDNIVVNGLILETNDIVWISTEKGLYRLNLSDHSFWHYAQNVEFNKRSFFKSIDTIYFGSMDGIFSFNPQNPDFFDDNLTEFYDNKSSSPLRWMLPLGLTAVLLAGGLIFFQFKTRNTQPQINYKELEPIEIKNRCEELIVRELASVTVDSLAEELGMTKRMLFRKLEPAGLKPGEIIRNIRKEFLMEKLKEQPNMSLSELSILSGYSENHLVKVLKEIKTGKKFMYK